MNVELHLFATPFPIYFWHHLLSAPSGRKKKKWFSTPHYRRKPHSENIALAGTHGVVPIMSQPLYLVQLAAPTCEFPLAGYRGCCVKLSERWWLWATGVVKNNIHIKMQCFCGLSIRTSAYSLSLLINVRVEIREWRKYG